MRGAAASLALPLLASTTSVRARTASTLDASFGSAVDALAALRTRAVSSHELVAHALARIAKHEPRIHAFVTRLEESAIEQAKAADTARARGRAVGALHGLPVVVKDAFATAGVRTTAGSKTLASFVPTEDAVVVTRLREAGAIILGKTNLPEWSSDWQSYNEVAGQTNNPWDLTRTPGGSTGGGAAALAAGFAFLEVGSDIAGSIRIPAHFCGIYGHKPTFGLVPNRGHVPPAPSGVPLGPLSVAGPMARSADDLLLQLGVLAGPDDEERVAYRWALPKPRRMQLRDYKLGFVLDDRYCPLDAPVRAVLERALDDLRKAGVRLVEGWPKDVDPVASHDTYQFMFGASQNVGVPAERRATLEGWRKAGVTHPWVLGATAQYHEWVERNQARVRHRAAWQRYFREHDAFLMPVDFVAATPHDHAPDPAKRVVATSQGSRSYLDHSKWITFATLSGCPATAAPVGRTRDGLPVGLQIMGPYLEDGTPIDIARKMAHVCGGFVPPPSFPA